MNRNSAYPRSQQQQQVVQRNTAASVAPQMPLPVANRVASVPGNGNSFIIHYHFTNLAATNNNQNQRTSLPNSVDGRARKTVR